MVKKPVTDCRLPAIVTVMDMNGMGFLVIEPDDGNPTTYWLTHPLGQGWVAAYRLSYHGDGSLRRARIRELRVVPGLPGPRGKPTDFYPSANYSFLESRVWPSGLTRAPIGPFSFDALRRMITPKMFRHVLAAAGSLIPDDEPPEEWGNPASQLEASPPRRAAGRPPRYPPVHYAKFALQYSKVENNHRKERGKSTRDILARRYKVPVSTIGKWIYVARQQGFISNEVRRGGRGGVAMPAADKLVERSQK